MNINKLCVIIVFLLSNTSFAQVAYDECAFLEQFFSKVNFEIIPYFSLGSPKPSVLLDEAKDTVIEVIDLQTYESKYVNQKAMVQEQWDRFYDSEKYIKNRDLIQRSFHLVYTNVELWKADDIKSILSTYFPGLSIDTSELVMNKSDSTCDSMELIYNQNFVFNKPLTNLSKQQEYDLRGIFRFGPVLLTKDKHYAIGTYDIYHKWINANGEATGMETGGGGIIILSLIDGQKIEYIKQFSDY